MKYFFILLADFMILVNSELQDVKFRPNFPLGEYRLHFNSIQRCNQKCAIQFNFYLFKTSRTKVELRGNMTSANKAFDDSLWFNGAMSVKDKIGTWQNNAYVYKSPHAYKTLKKILGGEFKFFSNSFGLNDTEQNSFPPGTYVTKGYDLSNYPSNTNLPKQIFYGTYKFNINYTEKNGDVVACFMVFIDVKRLWESESE
ncbi:uncharacterized protein LOC132939912 [Metopolophium dirhodum]|uniref:uncharacterized protein LOC132939912 n=1 Tax=Metopolophium dirhodum TaxID=44670 RepID=UPI002990327E|nr:uncharacterized protein LOC132939912 [Metopolophium dirhodum]